MSSQGTIAARLRAAGNGMPAIFTPAGAGTLYSEGGIPLKYNSDGSVAIASPPRQTQMFDGKEYVMEPALRPEVSLVKAFKADTRGNLVFRGTSQNANPDCAVAGKVVLAEAEIIVEAGEIDPDEVHLSGVYVDHLIKARDNEKRIERLRETNAGKVTDISGGRGRIVRRAAKEFKDGSKSQATRMFVCFSLQLSIRSIAHRSTPHLCRTSLKCTLIWELVSPHLPRRLSQKVRPFHFSQTVY